MNWKPSFVGGVLAFCYTDCYTDFPQRLGITYFRKAGLATQRGKNEPHTPPPVEQTLKTLPLRREASFAWYNNPKTRHFGGDFVIPWENRAEEMVEKQIRARGVLSESVLEAMRSVPRHLFLPERLRESAWIDSPLPIGEEQTISQPYMVAKMTELLAPEKGDSVLEIGTGSGYQSAVLASMGAKVTSMERIASLAEKASETLSFLGYDVVVLWSDGREKGELAGKFQRVIVTAAAPELEEWWSDVLAPGGRLVSPVSVLSGSERLILREKRAPGVFVDSWHDYCRFVPLLQGRTGGIC